MASKKSASSDPIIPVNHWKTHLSPLAPFFQGKKVQQRRILLLFMLLTLFTAVACIVYLFVFKDLPSPEKLGSYDIPLSTKIYDRNGELLFDIFAEENRTYVSLTDIPKQLQQATIAIEDKNFYQHGGINPIGGMLRAAVATVTGRQLQGGSTITQQLVKSALLSPERTLRRKIREIVLAFWVESTYSKDNILELYLNQVPYGGTAWGVEAAADRYFGKHVKDLNLAESSLLAGLPQAPSLYSPLGARPDLAKERQKQVLTRMVEDGYISQNEADKAFSSELIFKKEENIKAPHFVMYVKQQLEEQYGEAMVERGGLQVFTTLDSKLQEYAQASVAAEVKQLERLRVGNGAALVTKPATGEILAMVGSKDYFATPSGNFNVTTALRQPGSSIKPITYAIGIDTNTVNPATMFLDIPSCFGSDAGQRAYCPKNYDGSFRGPVQLRFALGNSLNIPAVKMMKLVGVEAFVASASAWGLDPLRDPSQYGLSLTLGGGEVRMTDMAEAFGVLANGGIRKDLISILKVTDKNGKVLQEFTDENLNRTPVSQLLIQGQRVVSPETAFIVSHILLDNNARAGAFGTNSSLVIPGKAVSVKTGTTDDLKDNWTIGYTPEFLVATWIGNNDATPMSSIVSGVTGAAPIWNDIMTNLLKNQPDQWPKQPEGVVGAQICSTSGLLPPNDEGDRGCPTRFEYFIRGMLPKERENLRKGVWIDKETGDLAAPGKTENVEPQEKLIVKDAFSEYCLDCQHDNSKPLFIR